MVLPIFRSYPRTSTAFLFFFFSRIITLLKTDLSSFRFFLLSLSNCTETEWSDGPEQREIERKVTDNKRLRVTRRRTGNWLRQKITKKKKTIQTFWKIRVTCRKGREILNNNDQDSVINFRLSNKIRTKKIVV